MNDTKKRWVYCCSCDEKTYEGMRQDRTYEKSDGIVIAMTLFMCRECFDQKKPWPGMKPNLRMTDEEIQAEFDRFEKNRIIHED